MLVPALNKILVSNNRFFLWLISLGALQSASEQEKMKIMAVLNALRSPAFQAELGITSSTGSSSPRDSDTGFHVASETGSISSSMTGGSDDHHQDLMPPPPPPPTWSQSEHIPAESIPREYNVSFSNLVLVVVTL